MSEIYSRPLVIGIDAGGTSSRAYLAEAAPETAGDPAEVVVLGRGTGGPGNALSVGRAELTRHLTDAVAQAVPADLRGRVAAVYGGFAGAAEGLGAERGHGLALSCLADALAANGITGAAIGVGGDTEVALASAPGAPGDGLVLIAGTGAIATRLTGRRRSAVVDGHGWLLGDEGSGFWLGGRAVRAALEALDGRGPWTSLVARVAAHYLPPGTYERLGGTGRLDGAERPLPDGEARADLSEAIVTSAYEQTPARLAQLSRQAVEAADEGDAVALRLLDGAADLLVATVRALEPRPGEPLVLTGGLLGPGGPLLDRVVARLDGLALRVFPVANGGVGAAALARLLL
ncbi:BadF/BadG/BcrA/BcrD ATPase family protein [Streptomyces sp. NPDC008139]|uniref:N-acetylglucosamine kinase n=1 Tax=Streptomyces sp. NPDC008139 TaxID=3364814 RepID=UPI0036EE778A